jgi:class 3 adenylate cyclase
VGQASSLPVYQEGGSLPQVLPAEPNLVDYIGDEMLAMWGAPQSREDQAIRAVRAALAMLGGVTRLNSPWPPTGSASCCTITPAMVLCF